MGSNRGRIYVRKVVHFEVTRGGALWVIGDKKERLNALARDYASMRDMFFRAPLAWTEILDVLADLEIRINSGARRDS